MQIVSIGLIGYISRHSEFPKIWDDVSAKNWWDAIYCEEFPYIP